MMTPAPETVGSELDNLINEMVTENILMIRECPTDTASKLKEKIKELFLDLIGKNELPDVQLAENAYFYSGECEARNLYRSKLREKVERL